MRKEDDAEAEEALWLWFASPRAVGAGEEGKRWLPLLSGEERARRQALRFERDREEFLATRALVRTALSHAVPQPPAAWRFGRDARGRPVTEPECGVDFNLSNCPELVVCLLARGIRVGVDAEPRERADRILDVAGEVFSAREIEQMRGLGEREKRDRALSLWTLKEAWVKALGMGLSMPLREVSFVFDGAEEAHLELGEIARADAAGWQFGVLDFAEHRIALAAETARHPVVEMREMMPGESAHPAPLAEAVRWMTAGEAPKGGR